jgi:hypothetical protein
MSRVLLAAEADRIQVLIFRSSRLREVTGASFGLETFWEMAADRAQTEYGAVSVPVRAGGSLRVLFDGDGAAGRAVSFERDLRDLYALWTGGHLSVGVAEEGVAAEPPPGFAADAALDHLATHALLLDKARGDPPAASAHSPYLLPCDSCGRDPAALTVEYPDESREHVCEVCARRAGQRDDFKDEFAKALEAAAGEDRARVSAALEAADTLPRESEEVGTMDSRGRVAYLLADGNGFGALFARTTRRDGFGGLAKLSEAVRVAGADALARATTTLLGRLRVDHLPRYRERRGGGWVEGRRLPVLPLITGGDDVFVLLPAPWAFWIAEHFAAAFVEALAKKGYPGTTLSCALVFCKATFPYRMAHAAGENALRQAKRAARDHPGASLVRAVELRATVSSGVLGPPGEMGALALHGGSAPGLVSVRDLFAARAELKSFPRKRRHQVEAIYAADDRGGDGWKPRLERALGRAVLRDGSAAGTAAVLRTLAREDERMLCDPVLPDGGPGSVSAAVDLLHLWDYLQKPGEAGGDE